MTEADVGKFGFIVDLEIQVDFKDNLAVEVQIDLKVLSKVNCCVLTPKPVEIQLKSRLYSNWLLSWLKLTSKL